MYKFVQSYQSGISQYVLESHIHDTGEIHDIVFIEKIKAEDDAFVVSQEISLMDYNELTAIHAMFGSLINVIQSRARKGGHIRNES